jgi:hypothetical protein
MPTAPLRLSALGVPVDLVFAGGRAEEARAALAPRWQLCHREEAQSDARILEVRLGEEIAYAADAEVVGSPALDKTMVDLTHRITYTAIDANRGDLLMLHAGAFSNLDSGAAVVAVAAGGTGKTTLCRTLAVGRGYLTDETVGIRADRSIIPYAKPLSVRRQDGDTKDELDPVAVGLGPAQAPPYVRALLLLDRVAGAPDEPVVEELDLFDAIVAIAPESSSLSMLDAPLHRLEDLLDSLVLVARVHYREAASLAPLVDRLIGAAR